VESTLKKNNKAIDKIELAEEKAEMELEAV
jgi:hypothetical protein